MGVRFRKSINLGGGFRINISKSGIGYSWGVKGFRVTKTANGRIRTTSSIPGTGISYSQEYGHSQNKPSNVPSFEENHYGTTDIKNENISEIYSAEFEDVIRLAKHRIALNKLLNILLIVYFIEFYFVSPSFFSSLYKGDNNRASISFLICSLIIISILIISKILLKTVGRIKLEYEIDSESQKIINERLNPLLELSKSQKVYRVIQSSKVINKKYEAGANETITSKKCSITTNISFPFKANIPAPTFKTGKEKIIFLPDKLLIIKGTKIGLVNYTDIEVNSTTTRFIEQQRVPKDTTVVGYTWKYVNKSGGPDRRFNNNPQYPICKYGELSLKSDSGLNTVIGYSNGNSYIVENLNNLNKPFSYFEKTNTDADKDFAQLEYDAEAGENNDNKPQKYPLRKSMMFWSIVSFLWWLFIAVDEAFLIENPSLIGGLVFLIPAFGMAFMFYILAKSPRHIRYILGREFGMTKPVFVTIMVIITFSVFYFCLFLGASSGLIIQ